MQRIWISFYGGVVFASIVCPIGWYFERVRREEAKRIVLEQMRLDNLLAQLNSMQQQMNPDFLLDSLHVLKAGTSDEWTREYVAELAGIYRYLLTLNHESCVVRLDEELRFTHAYIHILRQRFEEGLDLDVDVRPGGDDRYIPPLALQTVVENAVKHNSLSHDAPLRIRVFEEADKIVVENNLLPPPFEQKSGSTGIGLRNLKERYRLIGGLSPLISKGEGAFTVKLPLLPEPAGM
jgi:LytS/YehU family sensor histidine kinase